MHTWSIADINECSLDIDGCEHNCNNADGSYYCSCITGYALTMNGKNCTGKHNAYLKDMYLSEKQLQHNQS